MRQYTKIPGKMAPKKKLAVKAPTVATLMKKGSSRTGFKKVGE